MVDAAAETATAGAAPAPQIALDLEQALVVAVDAPRDRQVPPALYGGAVDHAVDFNVAGRFDEEFRVDIPLDQD